MKALRRPSETLRVVVVAIGQILLEPSQRLRTPPPIRSLVPVATLMSVAIAAGIGLAVAPMYFPELLAWAVLVAAISAGALVLVASLRVRRLEVAIAKRQLSADELLVHQGRSFRLWFIRHSLPWVWIGCIPFLFAWQAWGTRRFGIALMAASLATALLPLLGAALSARVRHLGLCRTAPCPKPGFRSVRDAMWAAGVVLVLRDRLAYAAGRDAEDGSRHLSSLFTAKQQTLTGRGSFSCKFPHGDTDFRVLATRERTGRLYVLVPFFVFAFAVAAGAVWNTEPELRPLTSVFWMDDRSDVNPGSQGKDQPGGNQTADKAQNHIGGDGQPRAENVTPDRTESGDQDDRSSAGADGGSQDAEPDPAQNPQDGQSRAQRQERGPDEEGRAEQGRAAGTREPQSQPASQSRSPAQSAPESGLQLGQGQQQALGGGQQGQGRQPGQDQGQGDGEGEGEGQEPGRSGRGRGRGPGEGRGGGQGQVQGNGDGQGAARGQRQDQEQVQQGGAGQGPGSGTVGPPPLRASTPATLPPLPTNPGAVVDVPLPPRVNVAAEGDERRARDGEPRGTAAGSAPAYSPQSPASPAGDEPVRSEPVQRWPNWIYRLLHEQGR